MFQEMMCANGSSGGILTPYREVDLSAIVGDVTVNVDMTEVKLAVFARIDDARYNMASVISNGNIKNYDFWTNSPNASDATSLNLGMVSVSNSSFTYRWNGLSTFKVFLFK